MGILPELLQLGITIRGWHLAAQRKQGVGSTNGDFSNACLLSLEPGNPVSKPGQKWEHWRATPTDGLSVG